jgi:hypothetical protein
MHRAEHDVEPVDHFTCQRQLDAAVALFAELANDGRLVMMVWQSHEANEWSGEASSRRWRLVRLACVDRDRSLPLSSTAVRSPGRHSRATFVL